MDQLPQQELSYMPGTREPLRSTFTGFARVDRQLAVLVTFFAPVTDGGDAALTAFSIAGAGQFGAIWTLLVMEALRRGNNWKAVS